MLDNNWGINFDAVDSYKKLYLELSKNNEDPKVTGLIKEEVYNPLFRQLLKEKYGYNLSQTESFVVKAVQNGVSSEELNYIASNARENVLVTNTKVLDNMVNTQIREVIKSMDFDPIKSKILTRN